MKVYDVVVLSKDARQNVEAMARYFMDNADQNMLTANYLNITLARALAREVAHFVTTYGIDAAEGAAALKLDAWHVSPEAATALSALMVEAWTRVAVW